MNPEAHRQIAQARAACTGCPYHGVCPLAPLFLQAEARGERRPHPHAPVLAQHLAELRAVSERPERDLLEALGGADEGLALVAGCLLAVSCWQAPERLRRLLAGIRARGGEEQRQLGPLEEQIVRAAALLQDPQVPPLLAARWRLVRGDREVTAYEANRLVTRLISGESPGRWWDEAVVEEDRGAFEASFVLREKDSMDESASGSGALDLFFSARAGGRSAVFYYRRDGHGKQALVPIESIRPDSLLKRLFKVFNTDRRKTHRLFAKIARYLNNEFGRLDKRMLWEGLKQLEREQQIVLTLYAPRLGKYIEKRARFPGLYRLAKFLHRNLTDKGYPARGAPSHAKLYAERAQVQTILEAYGKEAFKEFCRHVFRIAEAYRPGPASADLIFRVAEAAYFLTALGGLNPAGLELSLEGRNPLAYIAYGLQPPARNPARRLGRLLQARARFAAGERSGDRELLAAVEQGIAYMAKIHGFEDAESFEKAVALPSQA
ncbi:MAG: hypothetical protein KatS3mg102_1286 [Planctomycetota bacterium]|nr:MAG: hypothetical protein KatS3mg102_1286 [Planctomycetota bacterium]